MGGGLVFLHYQCEACAEVWTAMVSTKPAVLRPATTAPGLPSEVPRNEKLWLN
jgi:hypothetical protein